MQTHVLPFTFFHKTIHVLIYYKTLLVSQILSSVSGSKAVDPLLGWGPHQTAKICPKAMLKGLEINLGCDYGQLGGLPRKDLSSHQLREMNIVSIDF